MRRPLALLLVLALLVTLCGCKPKKPADVIARAYSNLLKAESMHVASDTDISMLLLNRPLSISLRTDGDLIVDPTRMHFNVHATALGQDLYSELYLEEADGALTLYENLPLSGWSKQTLSGAASMQYDVPAGLGIYLDRILGILEAGDELVGSTVTTRYDCALSPKDASTLMIAGGVTGQLAQMLDISEADVQAALDLVSENCREIRFSIWIDRSRLLPLRYEVELTELTDLLVTKLMEKTLGDLGSLLDRAVSVSEAVISCELSQFDTVADFEVPEGVRTAAK